jgi:pilus assembly protein FimV
MDKPLQENGMAIDDSLDREDIALSTSELDDVLNSADLRSESGDAEGPDLEKYGIWIKVEPQAIQSLPESEEGFELSDLDAQALGGKEAKLTAEEEQLLGELESDDIAEAGTFESADFEGLEKDLQQLGKTASPAEEDEDLTVADLDLGVEGIPGELPEAEIEVPLSEKMPALDSLEEAAEEAGVAAGSRPRSEEILRKIELDLKQIKLEIQNLKRELAGISRAGAAAAGLKERHAPAAAAGFFAEEEDDSIALTGDELDNILNTADITEERAGSRAAALEEELAVPEAEAAPVEELEAEPEELAELIEPGSLSAGPDEFELPGEEPVLELPQETEVELEALEEPQPEEVPVLDLETLAEEPTSAEAVAQEPEELLLEELGEGTAEEMLPEEPGLEEPASPAEELTLEDFSGPEEPAVEALGEAEPAEEAFELGLAEELPSGAEPAEELALVEELGASESTEPLQAVPRKTEPAAAPAGPADSSLPPAMRDDVKSVLSYLDQLLEALPDEKVRQFAQSEYFGVYKRLFEELGLGA